MKYRSKKIDDCFADSKTWQYALEVESEEFLTSLDGDYEITLNRKYRRPFFIAENPEGIRIKGVLSRPIINVSYPQHDWDTTKQQFEAWLEAL